MSLLRLLYSCGIAEIPDLEDQAVTRIIVFEYQDVSPMQVAMHDLLRSIKPVLAGRCVCEPLQTFGNSVHVFDVRDPCIFIATAKVLLIRQPSLQITSRKFKADVVLNISVGVFNRIAEQRSDDHLGYTRT
jgi:hypothetical protein